VLGSLAYQLADQGFGVKIITGDRDLLQLVNERILVNLPGKGSADSKDYFAKDVLEYLGVRPDQVVDYKALVGDTSDNIPGVTGIGEKTAASLLQKYDTLEGVYAHLDELSEGVRKKLEAGHASADLSRRLATIVTGLKINLDLDKARTEHFDPAQVEALFRELEFRSLLGRLTALYPLYGKATQPRKSQQLSLFGEASPAPGQPAGPQGPIAHQVVDTAAALQALVERLQQASLISFDTETTSTDPMRADLVGISLAVDGSLGYYIPVGHNPGLGAQLPLESVLAALRGPLTDPHIPKVGHNIKYDFVVLARLGLRAAPLGFDTMLAEWLTNPASRNLGLKNLAWVRLGSQNDRDPGTDRERQEPAQHG
jgi:DNA polymerase-1